MSVSQRSSHGCWTCRTRKKKCDEARPSCTPCKSLSILCHGYGPKPEWLDGDKKEREMVAKIQHVVKQETSRKKRLWAQKKQNHGSSSALGPADNEKTLTESDLNHISHSQTRDSTIQLINRGEWSTKLPNEGLPDNGQSNLSSKRIIDDEGECLLMYYLDYVFPLQFRFYRPLPSTGGRGWLLSILLRTKPLYYAAITLSDFHRQASTCQRDSKIKCTLDDLLNRHVQAIKELRLFLKGFGPSSLPKTLPELIELIACMALLVSLEHFRGDTDNWEVHLHAATSLIPVLQTKEMANAHCHLSPTYRSALYFFGGVIAWYDILSCATTGAKPFGATHCSGPCRGYIDLDALMGCENWVMHTIQDIARLNEEKQNLQNYDKISTHQLAVRGAELELRLEEGLKKNATEEPESSDVRNITLIFACSALVYLHVVLSGANPRLPKIQDAVYRTIKAFQSLPDPALMRDLVWPFCIAGCMANTGQEDFFRRIEPMTTSPLSTFGISCKALEVVEECWRLRKYSTPKSGFINWNTAMESLGLKILLV